MQEREYAWLAGIMKEQEVFEQGLQGTDGTLEDYNSPEHILERGIVGEAQECLEALQSGQFFEAKIEAVDVLIFLASLFNHLELSAEDVERLAHVKMSHNYKKYKPEYFEGVTVKEGMQLSRDNYGKRNRVLPKDEETVREE